MKNDLTGDELPLLKRAVEGLVHQPHSVLPLGPNELLQSRLAHARIGPNGSTGFLPAGWAALAKLASVLHSQEEYYRRGVALESLRKAMENYVIDHFLGYDISILGNSDVVRLKNAIATWVANNTALRTHYVPFNVGPVRFVHAQKFWDTRPDPNEFNDIHYDMLIRALRERHATWIAIVDISSADECRSTELANLATDMALAGLQLILPKSAAFRIARINGRTWPSWISNIYSVNNHLQGSVSNEQPGISLQPTFFEHLISANHPLLNSVGRRICSFLNINVSLSTLERSWCDASYWFHEALAEPMDTISLAKFETTIEILLAAESSKKSTSRIREALRVFLGLKDDDLLFPESSWTVDEFAKTLVKARSRVLHGTWSTLTNEMSVNRQDIAPIAWLLLRNFTRLLDRYLNAVPGNNDNIESFLAWIDQTKPQIQ
jgi:hypothetical protein